MLSPKGLLPLRPRRVRGRPTGLRLGARALRMLVTELG